MDSGVPIVGKKRRNIYAARRFLLKFTILMVFALTQGGAAMITSLVLALHCY